ncbi:Uncharacterized protein FKW44_025271 [Caligus rogercresseyi]|uniref:Secreted protein n=1 Tax=Caligus rogercresseyi TaxID=217165 RepID=A0A7T8GL51_CALRO|nr:Uncharacterized protein FKW44_025271 [Caligus rogercresseyi]
MTLKLSLFLSLLDQLSLPHLCLGGSLHPHSLAPRQNLLVNIIASSPSNFLGSDSREQFLEMGSYIGTSPRLSCVTHNSLHPPLLTTVRSASIC